MPKQDGVEIYDRFYPWPSSFRLGDPVLVKEVTGMSWPEFVRALDEMDDNDAPDQVVIAGLLAVAFWQGNPNMSRDKARRAIERMPQDQIEIIDSDEDDVDPPAQAAPGDGEPKTTSSGSGDSPEALG